MQTFHGSYAAAFGTSVRLRRQQIGMTQVDLSGELTRLGLRMEPTTVTRLETGKRPVRLEEAVAIAQVLGVGLAELLPEVTVAGACEQVWWERARVQSAVERFDQVQQKLRELVERVGTAGLEKEVQEALDYTVETAVGEARELRQLGGGNGEHPEAS